MLSLRKKPGDKKESEKSLAWHPDFRELSALPDTKTVRTSFFVNTVAVFLVSAFGIFMGVREFNIATVNSDIAQVEAEIQATQGANDRAVALFVRYQAEEKRYQDATSLAGDSYQLSSLLSHLAELLPIGTQLEVINFRGNGQPISLGIRVSGVDSAASSTATQLVKTLQADPVLLKDHESVKLDSSNRNETEGAFKLALTLKPKTPAKAPPVKK